MKFVAVVTIWLLVSCIRCEENNIDNLDMFDRMDSTLGLFERHFGESVTKKLSFALFKGTQKMRSPMKILSNFMEELTPEETDSISEGIASAAEEVAELLKQPEVRELLSFAIKSVPAFLSTLNSMSLSGEVGSKDDVPLAILEDKFSDPFESKAQDKEPLKGYTGEDMMAIAGDLLKSGSSLLGSLGLSSSPKKAGGGLVGIATMMLERMIEEGVLDEEFMKAFDEDDDTDEGETKSDQLTEETPKEAARLEQPEPTLKSNGDRKNEDEINHSEL